MDYRSVMWFLVFLVAWVVLNRWVLPWLGVPTCMGGACSVDRPPAERDAQSVGPVQDEGEER